MKTFVLRATTLVVLTGASWAVWAADGVSKRGTSTPVEKPKTTLKVVDSKPAERTAQQFTKPAAPTATTVPSPTVDRATTPVSSEPKPADAAPIVHDALPPRSTSAAAGSTLPADSSIHLSHSSLAPTPEMWFFEQMRQDYNNPALQARLRGEQVAAERRARLAARAWYGVSNSRPMANVTPFMYYYSPFWGSNTGNPFIWGGGRHTTQVIIEARRPVVQVSNFGGF